PAITISQSNQFRGQVEPVGQQPPGFQLTLVVGALDLDQPELMALEFILMVGRAQPFQSLVAHDACLAVSRRKGALRLHRISAVVLDASDERRARFEDLSVEFVVEIAAINDVQTSRPKHRPEPIGLRAGRYGNGGIDRDAAEDVEVEMKLDSSMLGVLP